MNELIKLVKSRQWEKSRQRIFQAPDDIFMSFDVRGRSVLHVLLSNDFSDDDGADAIPAEVKILIELIMNTSMTLLSKSDKFSYRSPLLFRDQNDNTPLHVLCGEGSSSPTLIKLLLSYCPSNSVGSQTYPSSIELISAANVHGCTPLHFLAECHCPLEALVIILNHCVSLCPDVTTITFPVEPDKRTITEYSSTAQVHDRQIHPAFIKDNDGDTPLHYACGCASDFTTEHVRVLLQHCPSIVKIRNNEHKLPMDDLCFYFEESWSDLFHERILDDNTGSVSFAIRDDNYIPNLMESEGYGSLLPLEKDVMRLELWEVLNPILEATYFGSAHKYKYDLEHWKPLHAAAGITHHGPHLLRFAMQMKPEDITITDEDGNLPLHIAAITTSQYSPFENVQLLLDKSPECAKIVNRNNKLPFDLAVESKKDTSVLLAILARFPDALQIKNRSTGLLPFMTAAVGENNTVNVVYTLLRMSPELIRNVYN